MSATDARTRLLSPGTIRGAAMLLCVTSIVGMIVTSIADRIDAAIAPVGGGGWFGEECDCAWCVRLR